MSIQEVKEETKFKTSDGRKFSDKLAAERHELLLEKTSTLEQATAEYETALAASYVSADGIPLLLHGNYFVFTDKHKDARVSEIMLWQLNTKFRLGGWDGGTPEIVTTKTYPENETVVIAVSDLYSSKKAAYQRLLECKQQELKWLHGEISDIEETIAKSR